MSMATQCPVCNTTFRVTPQQLQAQHGKVRCGRCATVFDGFSSLAALPDEVPFEIAPPAAAGGGEPSAAAAVTRPQIEPGIAPDGPRAAADDAATETRPPIETAPAPEPAWEISVPESLPVSATEPLAAGPLSWWRDGGWAFGILLLLIILGAQAAYFNRSDIAAGWPEARPYLAWLCGQLRCTVALPQQPKLISIEGSDMMATDSANPGLIALTATLRNQATIDLGYPALDVVLTNTRDHTVARRIFLPAEYLGPGRDARAGIPPNAEITIRLDIDSGDLGAAGFRLELLRAPMR